MYLKRIEIQGFKSFADKTEIEFKDDITAIVGPNGSGKSNISDAIRWVLGEQSIKNLRGNKMEDVIFSGTDKRRALGYAEVSIIFDNKDKLLPLDYSEIMITRRVFRSGESEYYINKNSCRLKDIRELFMDSGVGKDGYSIIGQGRIEEILSNRPEDRRNIFEEAAEIVKYKTRKQIAEKKLDKTQANLIRIKDLMYEIKKQAELLEEESKKAINFTSLYNKLRDLEVNLYIKEIRKFNIQIKDINEDIESINKDTKEIEKEKENIEVEYNILKNSLEELETKLEESRNKKYIVTQSLDNSRNNISIHLEKQGFYKKDLERINVEKNNLESSLNHLDIRKQNIIGEQISIKEKMNDFIQKYEYKSNESLKLNSFIKSKEEHLENYKSNQLETYNQLSDAKSKLNNMDSFNLSITKRIEEQKQENINITTKISDSNKELENIIEEKDGLEFIINKLNNEYSKLLTEKTELSSKQEVILKTINDTEIKLQGIISNEKLYVNMEEGYEGYFKSVKNLLNAINHSKEMNNGFHGIVADLIQVDEKYERAIDISLSSNIQNLIMNIDKDAKRLIDYLKLKKIGRVTFLPLNTIKGNIITLKQEDIIKYNILGLGYELIKYDQVYENIFKYLLGRTIIIKDMDSAITYANKCGHINRIVTLEGDVLNPGGSMTGGSYGTNNISIISRKNKIKELGLEIEIIELSINNLKSDNVFYVDRIQDLNNKINSNRLEKQETEMRLIGIESSQTEYNREILRLESEYNKIIDQIHSLEKEKGGLDNNKEKLSDELLRLEEETEDINCNLKKLIEDLSTHKTLKEKIDNEVMELKINMNQMENILKTLNEKELEIIKELDLTNGLIKEKNNSIILNQKDLENIIIENQIIIEIIEKLEKEEGFANTCLNIISEEKASYMKKFYGEQDRFKEIINKLSIIEKQKNKQELKLAKLELVVDNNHIKLLEDYEVRYDEVQEFEKDIPNIQKANEETKLLKDEIKKLGSVNIGSIEEYNKIKERLDFITTQQEDLIFSRENLRDIIKDIEEKMKIQFMQSFNEINEHFNEIFAVLFDGGTARLVLENTDDVLETGIDIVVQPPGKKLQTLSLLSGGEKSLTAVALLFAILKTKPSPFCILDEIDAALDEANISRYTNYLKHFNEDTQFILITHRKTTMEIANVLYGVTMAEEGISKLISVKLKDSLDIEAS